MNISYELGGFLALMISLALWGFIFFAMAIMVIDFIKEERKKK